MAEITPVCTPTDVFSLGALFGTQESSDTEEQDFNVVFEADGDYLISSEYNDITSYSQRARYGDATPDIKTDLATKLTTFGDVEGSGVITSLEVEFVAGEMAAVNVTGHQHATVPHVDGTLNTYNVSGALPAAAGLGVPVLIVVTGDVSPVRATVTFEIVNHIDKIGADGTHFSGQNMSCRCAISVEYEGLVTGQTAGDWLNILVAENKVNTDTPTSTLTAEQYFAKI